MQKYVVLKSKGESRHENFREGETTDASAGKVFGA